MKINLSQSELETIMNNFGSNHDDSIQFDEFLVVLSAYILLYLGILMNLSASSGFSKFSKSWIRIVMV